MRERKRDKRGRQGCESQERHKNDSGGKYPRGQCRLFHNYFKKGVY